MTDQELKDLVASLAISQAETSEQMRKTDEQMKKTDEQMKKTDEQMRKTDEQIEETGRQMRETDRKIEETSRQMKILQKETSDQLKETGRKLDKVGELLGNISNNQGAVTEEFFINSLKDTLQIGDIKFDVLLSGVELNTKKIRDEFDILLVNGDSLALIEVKYRVHPNLIERLSKKIEHIKMMPSYKNYKIYAGVAGFKIPQDAIELATNNGYFVLQRRGDVIETISDGLKVS